MRLDRLRIDAPTSDSVRRAPMFSRRGDVPAPPGDGDSSERGRRGDASPSANGGRPPALLGAQRIAALRRWIAEGGHNSESMAEQVARRILERGDIR